MFLLLLFGCPQPVQTFDGVKMSDFWPVDGDRAYTYQSEDDTIDWQLRVEMKPETSQMDDREVFTFEVTDGTTIFGSFMQSTVAGDAVLIHGYSSGAAGEMIMFDPAVAVTDSSDRMRVNESVTTETEASDGTHYTFTSTYAGQIQSCPNIYTDKWEQCVNMVIDEGDGDATTGPIFAGDYVLVTSYWVSTFSIPAPAGEWDATKDWALVKPEYTPPE